MPPNRTRPYRKHRRAELEQQTRERIVEAAVDLHGSVGPARTTVSGVAQRAGVQRATVYRHFPDDESLFAACSAHWRERNPRPDLAGWATLRDPDARLALGLGELYAWFGRTEQMIGLLTRDAAVTPSMRTQFHAFSAYFEAAADTLLRGRPERGAARRRVRAGLGHAVAFETWRSLVQRQGLTDAEAVELVRAMVTSRIASPME
jgi:AcrR family transcriptional regulator